VIAPGNHAVCVRAEDAFDLRAVDGVLKGAIAGLEGEPSVRQFPSGASNLTYLLSYANRDLVLRRPPKGARPKSGHSMIREYSVIKALKPVFKAVPEALYYADDDLSVLGVEFYVMEKVEGVVIGNHLPTAWGFDVARTCRFCETFWEKLIELHQVDYDAAGLGEFGKPKGYVARQVGGWNSRYEEALTADQDRFEDVRQWLEDHKPADEIAHSVVHGDFRIDNLVLGETEPHAIAAVLDWEISALGDPLMDLGASLVYWVEKDDPAELKLLKKQPSDAPGMMTRKDVISYYMDRTGWKVDDFRFYYTFGVFRLAVIAQQIYYRYFHKQTTNPAYAHFGKGAQGLGRYAQALIHKGIQ
jgi:aminoglycoside phosphotransferase (APT) family kinase protein